MRTEFPAHLLLTPSGRPNRQPSCSPKGRGAAARQMAAFTYSWESPLRRGVWCVCDGGAGQGELGGWLCFGEGNILEHAGIHTHTRVHKEHWIFILATGLHPWTFHTQTPSHTNPQSFPAWCRPYHVHKPSHLEQLHRPQSHRFLQLYRSSQSRTQLHGEASTQPRQSQKVTQP